MNKFETFNNNEDLSRGSEEKEKFSKNEQELKGNVGEPESFEQKEKINPEKTIDYIGGLGKMVEEEALAVYAMLDIAESHNHLTFEERQKIMGMLEELAPQKHYELALLDALGGLTRINTELYKAGIRVTAGQVKERLMDLGKLHDSVEVRNIKYGANKDGNIRIEDDGHGGDFISLVEVPCYNKGKFYDLKLRPGDEIAYRAYDPDGERLIETYISSFYKENGELMAVFTDGTAQHVETIVSNFSDVFREDEGERKKTASR